MNLFRFNLGSVLCSFRLVFCLSLCSQLGIPGLSLSAEHSDYERLQGVWEGFLIGHESDGKIRITVDGNSLHFHRDEGFWFKTVFKLPEGVSPKQLHTEIKDCPAPDLVGENVFAIYKFEKDTLILVSGGDSPDDLPKDFKGEDMLLYDFKKVKASNK